MNVWSKVEISPSAGPIRISPPLPIPVLNLPKTVAFAEVVFSENTQTLLTVPCRFWEESTTLEMGTLTRTP